MLWSVSNHCHNIIANSLNKSTTDWDHYDFLVQHRELSNGDTSQGLKALNDKLKDPSLKIHMRTNKRLSNLLDPLKTPQMFRALSNSMRHQLEEDDIYMPFTKTMLNQALFYMKSSVPKSTGLTKLLFTLEEESFILMCEVIAAEWRRDCLSHKREEDAKWPKPPTVTMFELHRHNIAVFRNLVTQCFDDPFAKSLWDSFVQTPRHFYVQLDDFKKDFYQTVHAVNDVDSRNWKSFLMQLSRKHFQCVEEHFRQLEVSQRLETEQEERVSKTKDSAKRTTECVLVLEAELHEAVSLVQQYDELVSKMNIDNKNAQQVYAAALEEQKNVMLSHLLLNPISQSTEDRERFTNLEQKLQCEVKALREHICQSTHLTANDVFILINLNFGLRRSASQTGLAYKIGAILSTLLADQDAVLYRPVEWVASADDANMDRRDIRDALFGAPKRGATPVFHTTELSLSRTTLRKCGGQFTSPRINAVFGKKATGRRKINDYVRADDWLEAHGSAGIWGSESLWATTSMVDLPINELGIWSNGHQAYVSSGSASRRERMSSSGVAFDEEIFARLCQGPLAAGKAVGIYDPFTMQGIMVELVNNILNSCHLHFCQHLCHPPVDVPDFQGNKVTEQ